MKIFISFSGGRSKLVATYLHGWLRKVLQTTEPWFSEEISPGKRWSPEIAKQLAVTQFGIVCVTPENQHQPWVNFEAGACSKSVGEDARVVPYLYEISRSQISGPLADFNMCEANPDGTHRLVQGINELLGEKRLVAGDLKETFDLWWPKLRDLLVSIAPTEDRQPEARKAEDMIEEVLERQRRMETMVGDLSFGVNASLNMDGARRILSGEFGSPGQLVPLTYVLQTPPNSNAAAYNTMAATYKEALEAPFSSGRENAESPLKGMRGNRSTE